MENVTHWIRWITFSVSGSRGCWVSETSQTRRTQPEGCVLCIWGVECAGKGGGGGWEGCRDIPDTKTRPGGAFSLKICRHTVYTRPLLHRCWSCRPLQHGAVCRSVAAVGRAQCVRMKRQGMGAGEHQKCAPMDMFLVFGS